jgi:hypothetical protein
LRQNNHTCRFSKKKKKKLFFAIFALFPPIFFQKSYIKKPFSSFQHSKSADLPYFSHYFPIKTPPQIATLSLPGNHIGPAGARSLAAAARVNHALVNVELQRNEIGGGEVAAVGGSGWLW